jgi:hypothetical protein
LIGEGNLEGSLQNVNLTGQGSLTGETGKVELESPRVPESKGGQVNLEGDGNLSGNPGSVNFTDTGAKLDGYLGKEQLQGNANLVERTIGEVELEGDARLIKEIGKVNLIAPNVELEATLGKEKLEAPKVNTDMPAKEELKAPYIQKTNIRGEGVNLEGPVTPLEGNTGSANLTGPPSDLIQENLGNSNPSLNPNNED